ncbi:MAG: hypothetical protein HKN32_09655 [Flavobacteriales bacterium]|nr:hypothetical protein [Flavobacteriales bacterium]
MATKFDVFEVYDNLEKHNIILSFKGVLTNDLVHSLIQLIEQKVSKSETNLPMRKKLFNVMTECFQNLYHHIDGADEDEIIDESVSSGLLMVAKTEDGYSIITGNFVANDGAEHLKSRLEEVNNLSREELREKYRTVLSEEGFSAKGGAGLGILDIARKSGEKLEYGFIPYDETNQFFSLNVSIKK